jgi:hypothetical protein
MVVDRYSGDIAGLLGRSADAITVHNCDPAPVADRDRHAAADADVRLHTDA